MIRSLAILYTYVCNAQCAMCLTSSGPGRREKMDVDEVKAYLDQAVKVPGFKAVCYTGGEPLIFKNEIVELLRYGRERGVFSKVISNAFWARSVEHGQNFMAELYEAGLGFLSVSTDVYHDPFIGLERVRHALEAARSFPIGKELSVVFGQERVEDVGARLRAVGIDRFKVVPTGELERMALEGTPAITDYVGVSKMPLQRIGNGIHLPEEHILLQANDRLDVPCPYVGRLAGILPGGDVYWCCCSWGPGRELNAAMKRGNAQRESLVEIDRRMEADSRIRFIASQGPLALRERVHARFRPGPMPDKQFASICEVCVTNFRDCKATEILAVTTESNPRAKPGLAMVGNR